MRRPHEILDAPARLLWHERRVRNGVERLAGVVREPRPSHGWVRPQDLTCAAADVRGRVALHTPSLHRSLLTKPIASARASVSQRRNAQAGGGFPHWVRWGRWARPDTERMRAGIVEPE